MMEERGITEDQLKKQMRTTNKSDKKFEVVKLGTKNRTVEGIEAFFIEYGLMKSEYDPNEIIEKTMQNLKLIEA
jgi:hypothetical protein